MDINSMEILSIDDNKLNLKIIENFVNQLDLKLTSYSNSTKALESAIEHKYDLIIIDYQMPGLNGLEFIETYRKIDSVVPIIMITNFGKDMDLQIRALKLGANDFLSKPMNIASFKVRVINMLRLKKAYALIENKALLLENEVNRITQKLRESEQETLSILGNSAEYRDNDTGAHTIRVAKYCKLLAQLAGLTLKEQDIIFYASPFHDLGKLGIPDNILLKPGKLTLEEFEIIKTHSTIGHSILKNSTSKYLHAGADIAISHHEKYDGTGYPKGIQGEDIPIFGRITAIADVFDALTSIRPYKKAWSFDEACGLLEKEKNKHFDPALVDLFLINKSEFNFVYEEYKGQE